jgi:hypothetical protein
MAVVFSEEWEHQSDYTKLEGYVRWLQDLHTVQDIYTQDLHTLLHFHPSRLLFHIMVRNVCYRVA